ncbi:alpha/beta fold hydrolase [Duganella radicis]|uniref:Alpha/beta fold hydrolase n=1 Tax=Duganella radicis TaxID=551988 RepID=A0A6L6PBM1_9BURK|nr:alpha/beta hydrolase [Duganella radicis]MTV36508.1 alpha/beta fold hydrolase [Duganella radicis]
MKNIATKAIAAATLSGAVAAATPPVSAADTQKPTVVLVHGAFVDGSIWNKVITRLEAKGLHVVAVQNPLTSLADDVAATRRVLDMQTGPVVLVGNSWGGVVITEAGMHERVKSLVYVAAFAPAEGQSITTLSQGYPTPSGFAHLVADKEGFLTLSLEGVQKHLAQFVPVAETRMMAATQVPVRGLNFQEKVSAAAWKTKPSWYLVSEQDHMIAPELQKAMARNISARTVSLPADHTPHVSRPDDVANLILDAVAAN